MIDYEYVKGLALSFPDAEEQPHFHKTSFRIKNKIFATLDSKLNQLVIKLSEMDQSLFCSFDDTVMYPVPNKWGKHGWTIIEIDQIPKETLKDALEASYNLVLK